MPNSKIKPEDTPKAKEILLKIEESKILVKKITTEALATPTSEELVKDKINSVLKSCKDFLSGYGTNYQELIKSSYNGLRSLANRCLNEVQSFFKNNKDNLLAKNLAQAFAKSDKPKKTVNRTFVINGGEATLEEDMSVKFKETSGEFGYDQMIIDDYQARVKEAINTISKQTLTEKTYREVNGRKVGAPVFVSIRNKAEMAVRYDAMKEELKELVADKEQYVIVSQHSDASLRCSPLQGLLYKLDVNPEEHVKVVLSSKELGSKKPKEIGKVDGNPYYSLKEAMSYGLFSYNCRHRFIKYIPGQKITSQYQYDSKAAEAKREIDTNMRTLERQIRMLKEREVLSLDPKERKAYIKASKQAQAKYRAYAQKHGRVINEWRCSITRSERAFNKEYYSTSNGRIPAIANEESTKLQEEWNKRSQERDLKLENHIENNVGIKNKIPEKMRDIFNIDSNKKIIFREPDAYRQGSAEHIVKDHGNQIDDAYINKIKETITNPDDVVFHGEYYGRKRYYLEKFDHAKKKYLKYFYLFIDENEDGNYEIVSAFIRPKIKK